MVPNSDMAPVEGINLPQVTAWAAQRIAGLQAPLEFSLIAGGHSNLTYRFVDASGTAYVLRRPPLGHVLESAHDMGREHRIVAALQGSDVPVAPALGLCTDVEVNDAPFYLMQFVEGAVLHDAETTEPVSAAHRQQISEHVVDVLAALHNTVPETVGLGDLGRKEAYLARQLKRWNKQWVATKTHEIPEMEATEQLLQAHMPEQIGAAIVHGDYRLGNLMVKDGRVAAVLDWELCTLGDPLADVGYLLNNWLPPEEEGSEKTPTGAGGFFSRDQLVERYTASTGRDLSQINYYRAFSHWRLAAITQGVYKRYLVGAMGENHDVDLELYKEGVRNRAIAALELLQSVV
jgi:aminoglycoside phosphotransferase (APT) family kinase protein